MSKFAHRILASFGLVLGLGEHFTSLGLEIPRIIFNLLCPLLSSDITASFGDRAIDSSGIEAE